MRLQENAIDVTTLTWVKPELDETLRQARNALQSYVEEGESPGDLRTCADLLHQVQGTLRMVELYGAALVAEEMEQLGRALIDKRVDDRDGAYSVLMQGIVQLPDYLERLQGGHRDIPIVLLPLLNQLRASRGEQGLSESVLFSPDLSRPLPDSARGPRPPLEQTELSRRAEALRGLFQGALLRWLKDDNSAATIRDLTDVCEQLVPITGAESARRLFWVAAGTLDALSRNAFPVSNPLKQALAKVEREIKRLAEGGDAAFRTDPPIELTKQLLYFVAHEGSDTGRIGEIRQVFGLNGNVPTDAEIAHARGSLSGNNRALLETVAVAIKDDLLRVKDALDLHMRTPGVDTAGLSAQVDALDRVADTLGMLGLSVPRRVVQDQRAAINDVVGGHRRDDESTLLDIAGALLYVEAALDDQVERLGREQSPDGTGQDETSNESRRLLEVLVKEAIVNFSQARQGFVGFVETHWDHAQLADVPRLLNEVGGALRILNMSEPAQYLAGVRQFTEHALIGRRQVPTGQQMDRLADALASLEYFLEALRDRRPNREQILEVARQSLAALGYWPLPAEPVASASAPARPAPAKPATPAPVALARPEPASSSADAVSAPTPMPAPAADAPRAPQSETAAASAGMAHSLATGVAIPGFDAGASEEIDDEIREVFLEEFEEEIDNLAQLLPVWRDAPDDAEALRPIRRVFHTLKGSGRLVGARELGEFSWKIESLLNRVLDGTRPASPSVLALVQLAFEHLPVLRAALQGHAVAADLEGIQATADVLATGEDVAYAAVPATSDAWDDEDEAPSVVAEASVADADSGEGPLFSIDPVLFEILKPEVAGHLETVDAWLADCAARGPQPVTDKLLRAIHTMNGAFAMTEVGAITDVTSPLEGFVKRALAHNLDPGAEGVALVGDSARAIRETVIAIERPNPVLPHFAALSTRAVALRDSLPESMLPSVPVHTDDDVAVMPQVVVMEAADTSMIPDFDDGAAAAAAAAAADAEAEAAAAEAAAAEAAAAEAAAAEAAAAEAAAAEAAAAEAAAAEAAAAEAAAAEAAAAEAAAAEAAAAEAAAAEAAAAEAAAAEAAAAEAAAAEAAAAEAAAAEAAAAEAAAAEAAAAEAAAAEAAAAEAAAAEAAAAEAAAAEAAAAEAAAAEAAAAEAAAAEAAAAEAAAAQAAAAQAAAAEAAALEAAAAEAAAAQAAAAAAEAALLETWIEDESEPQVAEFEAFAAAEMLDGDANATQAMAREDEAFELDDASEGAGVATEPNLTDASTSPAGADAHDTLEPLELDPDTEALFAAEAASDDADALARMDADAVAAADAGAMAETALLTGAADPTGAAILGTAAREDLDSGTSNRPDQRFDWNDAVHDHSMDVASNDVLARDEAADGVDSDAFGDDEVVAYAELPEDQLLSVADFLRQAAERSAAEAAAAEAAAAEAAAERAAEAAAAEAAAAEAAAAEAAAAEAAAAEAAAAEAAAAEAAAAEAAAAEAAAAEASAAEAAAAQAAAAEAETAAFAMELAEAEAVAAAEAAALAEVGADNTRFEAPLEETYEPFPDVVTSLAAADADEDYAEAKAFADADALASADAQITGEYAVEAGAFASDGAFDATPVPESLEADAELGSESLAELSDEALASMIATYDSEDRVEPDAPAAAAGTAFVFTEEFNAEFARVDAGDGFPPTPAPSLVDADPTLAAIDDGYYGMSLADLEALTSPDGGDTAPGTNAEHAAGQVDENAPHAAGDAPAEFMDLATMGDIPAWAADAPTLDLGPEAGDSADAVPQAVDEIDDASPVPADADSAPSVDEPVDATESAEPEVPADREDTGVFADAPEDAIGEEAAPALVAAAAFAPVAVAAPRPNVPLALDPPDPDADLDMTDLDPELLDLFLEESNDILDHSDGMLARLRDQIDDRDAVTSLQRDLHTLKGGARMAGIYAVGDLGHAMESLLESVAEGRRPLDATGVVVLERGFDRLHGMVARIGERKAIALPSGLIGQVEALSEGRALDAVQAVQADGDPAAPATVAAAAPARALSAPIDDLGEDEMTGVRAPQEQVRIRADLLDRLVNYAGEVAIYRARLEQQLGAFRSNLGELDQTTTRLREQLRRLDIETEAQIVARYQREGDQDERFDPLELDRFTNQQQLTRALNESANDLVNLQGVLDDLTRQYETLLLQQSRVSSDLQEGLMRTRMVPFDALVPRLRRVLRQAATDTGKQVQLKVDGASGEMDRNVLDRMTAPLEHMLRNAMAHGLETPEVRRKARKAEEGTVRIAVHREGSEVVLKVSDDGAGLDKEAIRRKAVERGVIKADAELSDEALYALVLEAGFSTAETVSRLSGRGVGMDVVYSEIRQLGGTLQIRSDAGRGSEFTIRLPFTLAVTQAVFVKIGDTSFAVPIASVQGVGRISRDELDKQLASGSPVFQYAGEDYSIHDLGQLIGHAPAKAQDSLQMPLLLARSGDLRSAISIDQVLGSREIVVKPVGPQVNSVPGIFGATIMGDGRVVIILDVAPLVRRQGALVRDQAPAARVVAPVAAARRVPVVMVVDDSITMRKVTGRVLERNNMEVLTAKDGVDAVEKMAERVPDLVLLDIEMPRMDGYEVAQNMRSDPRLKDVPIIMITSRTGEKHRQRAMDIGVDRYLGKPYQEPELMRNVFEMLGIAMEHADV